ncbi:unnamed protein product [Kuraishia capsulata CBS 1993]|uniref:Chloride channel protein n=1 Tax=Kuraishia capsulata CBS 1993 TaxID=1382522 RepID=W6MW84_9ASCO|nr:uncharacterized protein KUCA_T00002977001 [Kuraishia capsulata CBS 1993]CDK27000.1 unnamed protein product [Kuraishia capsulata CBS 1993]
MAPQEDTPNQRQRPQPVTNNPSTLVQVQPPSPQLPRLQSRMSTATILSGTHQPHDHTVIHAPSRGLLNAAFSQSIRSPIIPKTPATSNLNVDSYFGYGATTEPHVSIVAQPNRDLSPSRPSLRASRSNGLFQLVSRSQLSSDQQSLASTIGLGLGASVAAPVAAPLGTRPQRNFYDDFTTIDWVDDSIKQSERESFLKTMSTKSFRFRIKSALEHAEEWILIVLVSFLGAILAFCIDTTESTLIDFKRGYCTEKWLYGEKACCSGIVSSDIGGAPLSCSKFRRWSELFGEEAGSSQAWFSFGIYTALSLILAYFAVVITLTTKSHNPLVQTSDQKVSGTSKDEKTRTQDSKVFYTAYGSGVPEVKTILSGFVIRKFLGTHTLVCKSGALILAIASGLCVGKEGPYVHLATCIGNICCRLFNRINDNDLLKRQVLAASAAAGVALAFGSPLGAVLFVIEEVSYYLPTHQLLHIFFCAIMSILFLKFLDPYKTGKPVLFELSYESDWLPLELAFFIFIGIAGGIFGAFFCKFTQFWGSWFRTKKFIKNQPIKEVLLITLLTASVTYFNKYTRSPVPELLLQLSTSCTKKNNCHLLSLDGPKWFISFAAVEEDIYSLAYALVIKVVLTSLTFGLKIPIGVYVPSMAIGALFGRLFATILQYICLTNPYVASFFDRGIAGDAVPVVDLGIYAMIGAGAFMAGVTRMNVTLATILFELTSSYTYVLPISISIAAANWIAYIIEPRSLYEVLIWNNDFPFLDNRRVPTFEDPQTLEQVLDLSGEFIQDSIVHVEMSPFITASSLRALLNKLQQNSLLDGCVSVVKNKTRLIGLISLPKLELQLDKIDRFAEEYNIDDDIFVKLEPKLEDYDDEHQSDELYSVASQQTVPEVELAVHVLNELTDFSKIMETTPLFLEISSPLALVQLVFAKLGNREICVLDKGDFVGTLHKKIFIDYCRKLKTGSS